jgi:agmatinase
VQEVNKFIHDIVKSSDPVYITFEVDCLDLAFEPGTGTTVVGGLSTAQALPILYSLGDLNLIGMDIVEVAMAYDHAEITAPAAAIIEYDYLCLLAQKNGAQARSIGTKLDEKQSGAPKLN